MILLTHLLRSPWPSSMADVQMSVVYILLSTIHPGVRTLWEILSLASTLTCTDLTCINLLWHPLQVLVPAAKSTSFLTQILGSSRWWFRKLGSRYPCGRSGLSSRILASAPAGHASGEWASALEFCHCVSQIKKKWVLKSTCTQQEHRHIDDVIEGLPPTLPIFIRLYFSIYVTPFAPNQRER